MKTFHERIGELVEGCCVFQADEEIVMTANTGKDGYVGFNIFDGTIRFMEDGTHELLRIEKDGPIMKILNELFDEAQMMRIDEEREEMVNEQKKRRLCELQEQMREIMHEIGQMAETGISRDKTDI